MAISGLNYVPNAASFDPEQLAQSKLPEAEKVAQLAQQFEAVLLRQILHDAQKTVIKSDLTEESSSSDIYRDMIGSQLADSISQSGSFGFARALETQLTRQLLNSQPDPKE